MQLSMLMATDSRNVGPSIRLLIGAIALAGLGLLWKAATRLDTRSHPAHLSSAAYATYLSAPDKTGLLGETDACIELTKALPEQVYRPRTTRYQQLLALSFAGQARDDAAACIVQPYNTAQVSAIVKILRKLYDQGREARFAIRSGGHATSAGHSTIMSGVLIDMGLFNDLTIGDDRQTVIIGVGMKWGQVYQRLDRAGLRVAGGRAADVGVGGFILGGGISWLSPRVGLACDNIVRYEIVLANGTITEAIASHHAGLFRSLKGGSSNFGIVTRITAKAFDGGAIWGGYRYWHSSQALGIFDTFHDFVENQASDKDAASPVITYGYHHVFRCMAVHGMFSHNNSTASGGEWPASLRGFRGFWSVLGGVRRRTVADLALEGQGHMIKDSRQVYSTITIKNDREVLRALPKILDTHRSSIARVAGVVAGFSVQALPARTLNEKEFDPLESTSVGSSTHSLVLVLLAIRYTSARDDEIVQNISKILIADVEQFAISRGSTDSFVYLNYANPSWQDPISSYGAKSREYLRQVSVAYDPDRFFQFALEGGFKLEDSLSSRSAFHNRLKWDALDKGT